MNNLRFAFRQAVNHPDLSIVVVAMLALGIGATTAMFSLFHDVLLRPLPVHEPERLVNLKSPGYRPVGYSSGIAGGADTVFSYPMFRDLEERQDVFTGLAAHRTFDVNFSGGTQADSVQGLLVSGQYFAVLGIQAALGRLIDHGDDAAVGEARVAVLSHGYWRDRLGGDSGVVGRSVTVNGRSLTVIGVAPEGFTGTTIGVSPAVYVPLSLAWLMQPSLGNDENFRGYHWLHLFARLRDGVSVERAEASISALYTGIIDDVELPLFDIPDDLLEQYRNRAMFLEPGSMGQSARRAGMQGPLTVLLSLTVLVLLIVCVNIAGLLLARGAARHAEVAVRVSVGATRWQLVSQFLAETAVLAFIGGLASLPVATVTTRGIAALLPPNRSGFIYSGLDATAVMFTVALTVATMSAFGVAPALRRSRSNAIALRAMTARVARGAHRQGIWQSLAATQIALAVVLLVLAGLFLKSLANVARVDLGMDVDSVATFAVSPSLSGYTSDRIGVFFRRVEEELRAEPGVLDVGSALVPLLSGSNFRGALTFEGTESANGFDIAASFNVVSPGYFETLSTPILAGRSFVVGDGGEARPVAIVNEALVRELGLEDPLGRRFAIFRGPTTPDPDVEIVGVVADAKYSQVKDETPPQYYLPFDESSAPGALTFYVLSAVEPDALLRSIRRVVARVDPNVPVESLQAVITTFRDNVFLDRAIAILSAGFAGLATLVAAIGLYGVLAYNLSRRTRELGLRLALGSTPGRLRALVMRQAGATALIGGMIGLGVATGLGRVAESLLFGLSGFDASVSAAAVAVLGLVALGASYLPARRATRIDPMTALRED